MLSFTALSFGMWLQRSTMVFLTVYHCISVTSLSFSDYKFFKFLISLLKWEKENIFDPAHFQESMELLMPISYIS